MQSQVLFLLMQVSKRSDSELVGRTDGNMIVVFPNNEVDGGVAKMKPGEYVHVKVGGTMIMFSFAWGLNCG